MSGCDPEGGICDYHQHNVEEVEQEKAPHEIWYEWIIGVLTGYRLWVLREKSFFFEMTETTIVTTHLNTNSLCQIFHC